MYLAHKFFEIFGSLIAASITTLVNNIVFALLISLVNFQVIKMLIIIIVVFFVAWGPKLALTVMKKYQISFLYFPSAFVMEVMILSKLQPQSLIQKEPASGLWRTAHNIRLKCLIVNIAKIKDIERYFVTFCPVFCFVFVLFCAITILSIIIFLLKVIMDQAYNILKCNPNRLVFFFSPP